MNNQDIDFTEDLKEVENRTRSINEKLNVYKNKVQELQQQLEIQESSFKDAEQRAKSAEEGAKKAREDLKKATDFKQGQYEQLISDLFKTPQRELISHMEAHSEKSYRTTMWTAVGSIIISLVVSIFFQIQSSSSTNSLIARMEESQETTNDLLKKIDSVDENIRADENVRKIAQFISQEKGNFNNYQSKNDVALLFKIRLSKKGNSRKYDIYIPRNRDYIDPTYSDYISAFKISGEIDEKYLPANADELREWDRQFKMLCENAVRILDEKVPDTNSNTTGGTNSNINAPTPDLIIRDEAEKMYNTYKIDSDGTDYERWGHREASTYNHLLNLFRADSVAVERRMKANY